MDLGLLQKDVAAILDVSSASVFHWETGVHEPAIRFWPKIIDLLGDDPTPPPKTVAEGLKAARRQLGCSQKALARRLKVDPTSVRDWEKGRTVRFYRCRKLIKNLLVELDIEVR